MQPDEIEKISSTVREDPDESKSFRAGINEVQVTSEDSGCGQVNSETIQVRSGDVQVQSGEVQVQSQELEYNQGRFMDNQRNSSDVR